MVLGLDLQGGSLHSARSGHPGGPQGSGWNPCATKPAACCAKGRAASATRALIGIQWRRGARCGIREGAELRPRRCVKPGRSRRIVFDSAARWAACRDSDAVEHARGCGNGLIPALTVTEAGHDRTRPAGGRAIDRNCPSAASTNSEPPSRRSSGRASSRLLVQVPGLQDPRRASRTAHRHHREAHLPAGRSVTMSIPNRRCRPAVPPVDSEVLLRRQPSAAWSPVLVEKRIMVAGEDLDRCPAIGFDQPHVRSRWSISAST